MIATIFSAAWAALRGGIVSVLSAIWNFVRQPPGLYVALTFALLVVVLIYGHIRYAAGYGAAEGVYTAKLAAVQASLGQARSNESALRAAIDRQNAAITQAGAQTYAILHAQAQALAGSESAQRELAGRLAVYLAAPPGGADDCAQYRDIDKRLVAEVTSHDR